MCDARACRSPVLYLPSRPALAATQYNAMPSPSSRLGCTHAGKDWGLVIVRRDDWPPDWSSAPGGRLSNTRSFLPDQAAVMPRPCFFALVWCSLAVREWCEGCAVPSVLKDTHLESGWEGPGW